MTTLRRRVLRPPVIPAADARSARRLGRCRSELSKSRDALKRWVSRLKRCTHTVADLHKRIERLERQLRDAAH